MTAGARPRLSPPKLFDRDASALYALLLRHRAACQLCDDEHHTCAGGEVLRKAMADLMAVAESPAAWGTVTCSWWIFQAHHGDCPAAAAGAETGAPAPVGGAS